MPASLRPFIALALALGACVPVDPSTLADRGRSPLVAEFEAASQESGVPLDLLLAVGYTETRFSQRGGQPSILGGYGVMHLRAGSTLDLAARELGLADAEALRADAAANVRGAALALAALARESGAAPSELSGWRGVLERYSGLGEMAPDYAEQVFAVLAVGAQGADEDGLSIVVVAHPEVAAASRGGLGQASFDATPDYAGATWVGPSPNYSSRSGTAVKYVVIHTCQGTFSGCVSWQLNPAADVSAHYTISSAGKISQAVEEKYKAWHVGCLNGSSVGIEHEGYVSDPAKWYTEAMYCASAKLVRSICNRHGFTCDRSHVIGHKEANDLYCHGTHTDPGPGWNWTKFMGYVRDGCGGSTNPTTGRLVGYVYKKPDNVAASRIAGATVKLNTGATATTDATGRYAFSLAAGTYTATASASGYQPASVSRAVAAGTDTWGSIGLDPSGSTATGQYYGSVYEVNPANPADMTKRLPGAAVKLDTGAATVSRLSPADGVFKFDAVPAGTHTATATLPGYKTNSSTKSVAACTDPATCATWGSIGLTKDGSAPTGAPKVSITAPADGATLEEAQVDLTGQVDGATDVTQVRVEWAGKSQDVPLGDGASFSVPIRVPPGDTLLKVSATNDAGTGSASVTVHFQAGLCGFVYQQAVEGSGGESARIGGATVELLPATALCGAPAASTTAQSPDGTWCLDAAPGEYFLRVKAAEHVTQVEAVTVTDERREAASVGLAAGVDPAPGIELTEPGSLADGPLHVSGASARVAGVVRGMIVEKVTVAGVEAALGEDGFVAAVVPMVEGENKVEIVATGACGARAAVTVVLMAKGTGSGACGCATGGEGTALFALIGLAGMALRRRWPTRDRAASP